MLIILLYAEIVKTYLRYSTGFVSRTTAAVEIKRTITHAARINLPCVVYTSP